MLLCAWIIPRWSWRPLFVAIGLVAAIIWWLRRDIPESPRWLAVRGRYDEAAAIVKQLEDNGSEPIDAAAKADTSATRTGWRRLREGALERPSLPFRTSRPASPSPDGTARRADGFCAVAAVVAAERKRPSASGRPPAPVGAPAAGDCSSMAL